MIGEAESIYKWGTFALQNIKRVHDVLHGRLRPHWVDTPKVVGRIVVRGYPAFDWPFPQPGDPLSGLGEVVKVSNLKFYTSPSTSDGNGISNDLFRKNRLEKGACDFIWVYETPILVERTYQDCPPLGWCGLLLLL